MPRKDPVAYKAYMKAYREKYDKQYYRDNKDRIKTVKDRRRLEIRQWFAEMKEQLRCTRCPEDFWACIEFHHTDQSSKEYSLSDMASRGFSKKRILAELAKCTVLCANCHRKEHNGM